MVEEMHDVMMKVAQMVVISESDIVRTQSRHVSNWFTRNQTLCKHIQTHRHAHTETLLYPHTAHAHTQCVHAHTHNSKHTAVSHCRCCSSFFWTTPWEGNCTIILAILCPISGEHSSTIHTKWQLHCYTCTSCQPVFPDLCKSEWCSALWWNIVQPYRQDGDCIYTAAHTYMIQWLLPCHCTAL